MASAYKAEKEAKAAAKAAKEEAKRQKEIEFQQKLVGQFNDKQAAAKAAGTAQLKLKAWLQNPPYKCTDAKMQVSAQKISNTLICIVGDSIQHLR